MPKNLCCCQTTETYLAIPCRNYKAGRIDVTGVDTTVFSSSGGFGQFTGPGRYVDGVRVFDSTRQVIFMMRGAGGGSNDAAKGGNAAYGEYKPVATLNFKARPGAGGTAGQGTQVFSLPYAGGGQGYRQSAFGGGGSVIGSNITTSAYGIVAGAGGVGLFFDGGHGGTKFGITGFGGSGGGGGSQTIGGPGGGVNATSGSGTKGGRGAFEATPTLRGFGGGGGGGYYGGGGGGICSGGGGASSLIKAEREKYYIPGTENGPGAMCNPWIVYDPPFGLGGKRETYGQQDNPNYNGTQGIVAYYYMDKYCLCEGEAGGLPDKMFLCLSKEQYDRIIEDLGPQPPGGFTTEYQPIFRLGEEIYYLLGNACAEFCEETFRESGIPTDVKWQKSVATTTGEGGGATEFPPACCSAIVCNKICDLSGCNECPCEANDTYYCCEIEGLPDLYWSIYGQALYVCARTDTAWIDYGKTPQQAGYGLPRCLPVTSEEDISNLCYETKPDICEETLESINPDIYSYPVTFKLSGQNCFLENVFILCSLPNDSCWTVDPYPKTFSLSGVLDNSNNFTYTADEGTATLTLYYEYDYFESPSLYETVFEIEFLCDNIVNNASIGSTQTIVCGATVNYGPDGTFFSNIAAALTSLLNTTSITITGSSTHTADIGSGIAIEEREYFPSGALKKVSIKLIAKVFVTGYFSGGPFLNPYPLDLFARNLSATFTLNRIPRDQYLMSGPSALTVASVVGSIDCTGMYQRECIDVGLIRCAAAGGCPCNQNNGGQQPMGGDNCEVTCVTDSNNWSVTFN